MANRLATRIGLPPAEERPAGTLDVVRFTEPAVGAPARTKGSLYLLAQVTGTDPALGRAARDALEALERDYYYDLSAGPLGTLTKAVANANRRLYHQRGRLGIPRRGGVAVIALAIRGREGHVAKLGPASAVIVREGRMFELPPPPAVEEQDPRVRRRRVAATLGEALEVTPYTWHGELAPGDRLALVSRNLAHTVGVDELKRALATLRPATAAEHLMRVFGIRGGSGSDGLLTLELAELPATATTHQLEPVRPAEPLAGLPDQSPVPLADAIGRGLRRMVRAGRSARRSAGRGLLVLMTWVLAFVPRRRPGYPQTIPRTDERAQGRRRRLGMVGMAAVAGLGAIGVTVATLPAAASPTEAIPRATVAREALSQAVSSLIEVEARVDGANMVDRDPQRATELLATAARELERAHAAGVSDEDLARLRGRLDRHTDALYRVARLDAPGLVADLGALFESVDTRDMVPASDGSLWVLEVGRGRVVRVDPADGSATVIYRAGQETDAGDVPGEPWLMASAATDVVVIDRERRAWRIDLAERIPRPMVLASGEAISPETTLLAALQHRPPLEIFNLYLVDGATGEVRRWSPPVVIPVNYPNPPEPYLAEAPDLDPRAARDLRVDVNAWLLHRNTVTRVDFGSPRPQADYSLDPPPDVDVRASLDYRLLGGATVGERDYLYVYDAGNARIIAFQRADGAFVRQWMARSEAGDIDALADLRGLAVTSVADGPPVAYLLTADQVIRVVLE